MKWARHDTDTKVIRCMCGAWKYDGGTCMFCKKYAARLA